jgi:hypothetical protein
VTPLLLALLLSQSRDVDRTIQIYENWNLREHGTSATVSAPLRGLGCLPTGGVSGSAGVTTTRATGAALAEPAGAGQPYTFFDDLPNTVSHAAFNGTTLVVSIALAAFVAFGHRFQCANAACLAAFRRQEDADTAQ